MTTQQVHEVEAVAEAIGDRLGLPPLDAMRWLLAEISRTPRVVDPDRTLSAADRAALKSVGVRLIAPDTNAIVKQSLNRIQARSAWLTTSQVAALLGVGESMIRQRLGARQLFGVHDQRGAWRIPPWQFANGHIIPNLTAVLPRTPEDLPDLMIERFLTEPNAELTMDGAAVSPLDWLACGESPEPVGEMLAVLGQTP